MNRPGFLFPGQLSEAVGMGRDFFDADPEVRRLFAFTSERCGRDLERLVFSGPAEELGENLAAQAVHKLPHGGLVFAGQRADPCVSLVDEHARHTGG